ncbi:MAG: 2-isopropylmalate synthase [Candidatus Omnitrophota bacterium]
MEKIIIFDTTLRDGEQSPGASLNTKEKMEIAHGLARLGVDVLEAGFPIASPGDMEAVKLIAQRVQGPSICGLARARQKDIDAVYDAVKYSQCPRIHVFLATSKIHMKYKLHKAEDEILKQAVYFVKYAKKYVSDIEFSPEDASRSERKFLFRIIEAVIHAGAKTINIPDTVGYALPFEYGNLILEIKNNVSNIHKAVISVHCHNDLGLAVANSVEAIKNGARQVECTINGIGERAGNAALEEIVMAVNTRRDILPAVRTNIKTKRLYAMSRMVSKLTGIVVQPNKAIVGENAFSHEAGIHQDGILKKRSTYEIIKPSDVGFAETKLVLGKHSGRHAFRSHLEKIGFKLRDEEIDKLFEHFKRLADKKKQIFDDDLLAIIEEDITKIPEKWTLESMDTSSSSSALPRATISLKTSSKILKRTSSGDGQVDACYKAIDKITGMSCRLLDYKLAAVTSGKDALGEVSLKIKSGKNIVSGRGTSTDIIEASARAYLNAVNKLYVLKNKRRGLVKRYSSL